MPSYETHRAFSTFVFPTVAKTAGLKSDTLSRCQTLFTAGAVLPDVAYLIPAKTNIGRLLHAKTVKDLFSPAFAKGTPLDLDARILLAGVFSHLLLDAELHPFIYAYATEKRETATRKRKRDNYHFSFERALDRAVLTRYGFTGGEEPAGNDVFRVSATALNFLTGKRPSASFVRAGYRFYLSPQPLLKSERAHSIVKSAERTLFLPAFFSTLFLPSDVLSGEPEETALALFDNAADTFTSLFPAFYDALTRGVPLPARGFSLDPESGKPQKEKQNKKNR